MKVVVVNTTKTGEPAGWWHGDNKHAAKCSYLVEENHGEIIHVYTFSGTSEKDKNDRFSFLNLVEVTDSMIVDRIRNDVDVSRKRGEEAPVRYFDL